MATENSNDSQAPSSGAEDAVENDSALNDQVVETLRLVMEVQERAAAAAQAQLELIAKAQADANASAQAMIDSVARAVAAMADGKKDTG